MVSYLSCPLRDKKRGICPLQRANVIFPFGINGFRGDRDCTAALCFILRASRDAIPVLNPDSVWGRIHLSGWCWDSTLSPRYLAVWGYYTITIFNHNVQKPELESTSRYLHTHSALLSGGDKVLGHSFIVRVREVDHPHVYSVQSTNVNHEHLETESKILICVLTT